MADDNPYGRTFPGDPNPPARAPEAPAVAAAPAPDEGGDATAPASAPAGAPSRPARAVFRVSADEDGRQSVYMMDDKLETTRLGPVSISNSDELLNALGRYNDVTGAWSVPEKAARQLISGDLPIPDYVPAKYRANKALIARGAVMTEWLSGKVDLEDALARADLETLKMQVKEAPLFVWQGDVPKTVAKMWTDLKEAGPVNAVGRVAGETAGMAAFATDTPFLMAGGLTIGASLIVSKGASAPVAAALLAKGLETGGGALVFKRSYEIEGGNAAAEMLDKGFDEKTVKKYAPVVGVINGALEIVSFRLLAAPFKRTILRNVLGNPAVKKTLATAAFNYAKGLTGEITQEEAQEAVNIIAESMAADAEGRPELAPKGDEILTRGMEIGLKTLMGAGGAMVPGAVLEGGMTVADQRAQKAKTGARTQKVDAALKPAPATQTPAPAAPAETAAAAPAETIDSSNGDYFPRQERLTTEVEEAAKGAEAVAPEETAARVESALGEMDATPATYGDKIIEAERRGLVATRQRELLTNQEQIRQEQKQLARLERAGLGTKVVENRIEALTEENARIRGDIEFYDKAVPQRVGIEPGEDLTLKPATLENVAELGFTEGRKEVLGTRRKAVHDVAQRLELTQAELAGILKEKNYGTMGDTEFRNWLESKFKPAAREAFKRRVALRDVRRKQAEQNLEREQNIRLQAKLPSVDKMTTEQLFDYVDLLSSFDRGDRVLTPKRARALETTDFAGARTLGEVAERVRELWNHPIDTMTRFLPESGFVGDLSRGLSRLAARSPMHRAITQTVEAATEREDIAYMALREKLLALGAKALASRKSAVRRFLDPRMPEVFAHLEADDGKVYTGQVVLPVLTKEEQAFVDFVEAAYEDAYGYLLKVDSLRSRFSGANGAGYVTHVKRDLVEMIADIKDTGFRAFLKELKQDWVPQEENFRVVNRTGGSVGLRAHMKQSVFRTGEMIPTKNVIKAFDVYFRALHKKKALDRAVPQVDTMVDSLKWLDNDKSPDAEARRTAFEKYVGQYLSAKKGQTLFADWAPHGGVMDMVFRAISAGPSLAWIAFNPTLQMAAGVGEILATVPVVGVEGLARSVKLMLTSKEARKFLDNNTGFTGETVWARFKAPGKTLNETAGLLMYGLLQEWRVRSLQIVLLADATEAEITSGEISPSRLAEIKTEAARWLDVKGSKSVLGSTSAGAMVTQFKGWAIPILQTTIEDFTALGKQMAGKGQMTPQQKRELVRLLYTGVAVTMVSALISETVDEEDDSWAAMLLRALHRELFTVTGGAGPFTVLAVPPGIGYYTRLLKALKETWEGVADTATGADAPRGTYKTGEREGELKGPRALVRLLPGAALLRQIGIIESPQRGK